MISPLSPPWGGLCSVLCTISLSQVSHTPRTVNRPGTRAQKSQEYGLLSARSGEVCDENGRADIPLSIANPLVRANPQSTFCERDLHFLNREHFRKMWLASALGVHTEHVRETSLHTVAWRTQRLPAELRQAVAGSSRARRLRHSAVLKYTC